MTPQQDRAAPSSAQRQCNSTELGDPTTYIPKASREETKRVRGGDVRVALHVIRGGQEGDQRWWGTRR
jgi:hypothetical protein